MNPAPSPRRLDSWKEIAAFLGRDVRTVQRWEEEGLPVHRRPGSKRTGVFAYDAELDAWLAGRTASVEPDEPHVDAPALPTRLLPRRPFLALATALILLTAGFPWLARAPEGEALDGFSSRVLARSSTPLRMPRWADVNGDAHPDLIVSSRTSPVLLFLSAKSKSCGADARTCADVRIHTPKACYTQANHAADFNGDGLDDVLVSCVLRVPESHFGTGPTWIVWGRQHWPADLTLPADAGVTIATDSTNDDRVQACLNGPGRADMNGDGLADVLLAGSEAPFNGRLSAGALYVYMGRRHWPTSLSHVDADITIGGSRMGEGFGPLCATGDFDGDGHTDLAGHADELRLWELLGGAGRTYIIRGRAEWPRTIDLAHEPAIRIDGLPTGMLDHQLAFADLDLDGRDDLFFSAPWSRGHDDVTGAISVWRGRPWRPATLPFSRADIVLKGDSPRARPGMSLVPSDLDQDGRREVLAADPGTGAMAVITAETIDRPVSLQLGSGADRVAQEAGSLAVHEEMVAVLTLEERGSRITLIEPFSRVAIDVRPYHADDVILKPGVTAIAVLGRRNQPTIDPASLRAAGASPIAHTTADVNADGVPDLLGHFRTEEMKLPHDGTFLTLIARTRLGNYVRGQSPIRIVAVTAGNQ